MSLSSSGRPDLPPLAPIYNTVAAVAALTAWIVLVVTGLRGSDAIGYGFAAFLIYGTVLTSIDVCGRVRRAPGALLDAGALVEAISGRRRAGPGGPRGRRLGTRLLFGLLRDRTRTRLYLLPVLTGLPVFVVGCGYDLLVDPADLTNAAPAMVILLFAALALCLLGQIVGWLVISPLVAVGALLAVGLRGWGVSPLAAALPLLLLSMVLFAVGTVLGGDPSIGEPNDPGTLLIQVLNVFGLPERTRPSAAATAWLWIARSSLAIMLVAVVGSLWQARRLQVPGYQHHPPQSASQPYRGDGPAAVGFGEGVQHPGADRFRWPDRLGGPDGRKLRSSLVLRQREQADDQAETGQCGPGPTVGFHTDVRVNDV